MISFSYKKSSDSWGTAAQTESGSFVFSGSLDPEIIRKEQFREALKNGSKTALWLFAGAGLAAFFYHSYLALPKNDFLYLLRHNAYNQIFWLSVLTNMFLWSLYKQESLSEEQLNLLHFDANKNTAAPDVYAFFNSDARQAWQRSFAISKSRNGAAVTATDLFRSLLQDKNIQIVFYRLGVDPKTIEVFLKNQSKLAGDSDKTDLGHIPFLAFAESLKLHNTAIDPLMLLCALLQELPEEHVVQAIFVNINATPQTVEIIASWIFNLHILNRELQLFKKLAKFKPDSEINQGLTSVPTYFLDKFSTDLTRAAKHGVLPLALGRQNDLAELFKKLENGIQNVLVKGQEGSGRTTIIHELAYKMVTEQVPKSWQDMRLVKLELSGILGTSQRAEEALMHALDEAVNSGNIILVVEDIHQLAKAKSSQGLSLLELLVNFLQQSRLIVVATTTTEAYTETLHDTANFDQAFLSYELAELSQTDILLACCIRASVLEAQHQCFFRYQAIEQAVTLSNLYIKGAAQPQKAIAVLAEAGTQTGHNKNKIVTSAVIESIISAKTHIPAQTFSQTEAEKLLALEDTISKYVIGQKEAVVAVAEGLRRARSGLASTSRPLASFLFLGPTGVGKTELAKTLAAVYFGDERYLLRLDMSEYRGADGLEKLLGRQGDAGDTALVKHIKTYPFCLLLLDEYEKASSEILNIFLQILEDGRLTSGRGETLDLTHTMIIATSNAGTRDIQEGIRAGKTPDQIKTGLFNGALLEHFPPELLNRFDGVIIFQPLTQKEVEQVSYLQLEYLRKNLKEKGIAIEFSAAILEDISKNAFDPTLGARPIRRYIQDHVEGFVAKLLLSNKIKRGDKITIDIKDGKLSIV